MLNALEIIGKHKDLRDYRPRTPWGVNSYKRAKLCPMSLQALELNLEATITCLDHKIIKNQRLEVSSRPRMFLGRELHFMVPKCPKCLP